MKFEVDGICKITIELKPEDIEKVTTAFAAAVEGNTKLEFINASSQKLTYSIAEAGAMLGLSKSKSYYAASHGQIPTIRVGRRLLVPRREFHTMFSNNTAKK